MNLFTCIAERETRNVNTGLIEKHLILKEAFAFNMSPKDRREIRQIVYEHFEYIEEQWDEFQRRLQQ